MKKKKLSKYIRNEYGDKELSIAERIKILRGSKTKTGLIK
jgi:hypothetical protein